jgi:hypothetical protein
LMGWFTNWHEEEEEFAAPPAFAFCSYSVFWPGVLMAHGKGCHFFSGWPTLWKPLPEINLYWLSLW